MSHLGLPFNEFADTLAKWQAKHLECGHATSPASTWAASSTQQALWAYLYIAPPDVQNMYPLKWVGSELYLSATVTPVPTHCIPAGIITSSGQAARIVVVFILACSSCVDSDLSTPSVLFGGTCRRVRFQREILVCFAFMPHYRHKQISAK